MGTALSLAAIWSFLKKHASVIGLIAVGFAAVGCVAYFYAHGVEAGKNQVRTIVEKEHTETIKEVRDDEHLAQSVADKTGAAVANTVDAQAQQTQQALEDIRNDLKTRPAPPAGCPLDVAPDSVRERSNALVAQANRAAGSTQPAN